MRSYKGKEKVKVIEGEDQGNFGYVRTATIPGYLSIVLDNKKYITIERNKVEYISSNYFLSNLGENLKKINNFEKGVL